jgi:hypothetical protein
LEKSQSPISAVEHISVGSDQVKVFLSPEPLYWHVVKGLQ